jgi:type VI secretion system protein ImpH
VNHYVGPGLAWDLRLRLDPQAKQPLRLGRGARLDWTAWLGASGHRQDDVIFEPARNRVRPRPIKRP